MATFLIRYVWANTNTGENRDRVIWGYHVDAPAAPDASAAIVEFNLAWDNTAGIAPTLQTDFTTDVCQVYDVSVGGPPVSEDVFLAGAKSGTGTGGPQETQLCISRWVHDGLGRPIKKGRTYFGPISSSSAGNRRPQAPLIGTVLDFQEALHNNFLVQNWKPVVLTKIPTNQARPIVQYSIDDAWDTQRRRGVDPTTETVVTVPTS